MDLDTQWSVTSQMDRLGRVMYNSMQLEILVGIKFSGLVKTDIAKKNYLASVA